MLAMAARDPCSPKLGAMWWWVVVGRMRPAAHSDITRDRLSTHPPV